MFRQEFISGARMVFRGDVFIFVVNPGEVDASVQAFGFRGKNQEFDSDVNVHPEEGPPDGTVPAGHLWVYRHQVYEGKGGFWWFLIKATSLELVPSIELRRVDFETGIPPVATNYGWIAPGDFLVQPIWSKPVVPDAVGPIDLDKLTFRN